MDGINIQEVEITVSRKCTCARWHVKRVLRNSGYLFLIHVYLHTAREPCINSRNNRNFIRLREKDIVN